jgi:SAM-dependent methyltransferase
MGTTTADLAPVRLRCPSCGLGLGEMPASLTHAVPCGRCEFRIALGADYWDACADTSYPRDFARQWVLWEEGRLGDPALVYGREPDSWFRELLSHTSLRPEDLASKRVLEVGFGHGRLLRHIQQWSPSAYGIDLAKPLRSAGLRPGSAVFGNLLSMPFVPGQFDLVICRGVVHHTPDPEASFGFVAEQVADGGMLYLAGCYEPGAHGMLGVRRVLPWSWRYPEPVLLGLTTACAGLRSALEGIRRRKLDLRTLRRYHDRYKLDVFDVMAPRWSRRLGAETVAPWFLSRGFEVRKVGDGSYLGTKAAPTRPGSRPRCARAGSPS